LELKITSACTSCEWDTEYDKLKHFTAKKKTQIIVYSTVSTFISIFIKHIVYQLIDMMLLH